MHPSRAFAFVLVILAVLGAARAQEQGPVWQPAEGHIMTRWSRDVSPEHVHPEYPRPQMVRKRWQSLNGLWDCAIYGKDTAARRILVPFPLESALSGIARPLEPDEQLVYKRTFRIPEDWAGQRIRLHFGAVDWAASVRVNGRLAGEHTGGYDPFWFDITELIKPDQDNLLLVIVTDPTDSAGQPRGKQVRKPEGIWYTRTSGIWQSVWLEPIPAASIDHYLVRPDLGAGRIVITAECSNAHLLELRAEVLSGGERIAAAGGPVDEPLVVELPSARPWSPEDPFLYDLRLSVVENGRALDTITGYFGMREIRVGPDEHGTTRILLNGEPLFQFGPLDQGFWPDGLYTAPTDEALRSDIELARRMGCNMIRKHVKVEPDRFYYWCDRLGVLVWQDIPSANNPPESRPDFEIEANRIIRALANHPSIIMWVPFNEGWGQYETRRIVERIREWDPTRLVNNASGWTDERCGDVIDIHAYPGPASPWPEPARAAVLGEFGGLGLPTPGHLWVEKDNWGYVSFKSPAELTEAYLGLLQRLHPLIDQGLSAAVYTQTTDVEIEVNGWITYDREVLKIDPERAAAEAIKLYRPHGSTRILAPAAPQQAVRWRYTLEEPPEGWTAPSFDDSSWEVGAGGFGAKGTPGALVGTEWTTGEIWLRRTIVLPQQPPGDPHLLIHHDEDARVYLNGSLIAELAGYTTGYTTVPLDENARALLRPGDNTLAVHCRQTRGGQYIDAGLVDRIPPARD